MNKVLSASYLYECIYVYMSALHVWNIIGSLTWKRKWTFPELFDQELLCLKSWAASVKLKEHKKYITYQFIKNIFPLQLTKQKVYKKVETLTKILIWISLNSGWCLSRGKSMTKSIARFSSSLSCQANISILLKDNH